MTHALTTPAPHHVTQPAETPPTDDRPPVTDPAPGRADQPATTREVAEVIAERLTGLHLIRGEVVDLAGTATGHDAVVLDLAILTGVAATARVVLTLSVPPRPAEAATEDGDPR